MAKITLWTYKDAIDHAVDYMGGATGKETERFARRAVQLAVNSFQGVRNWSYFNTTGRINLSASYSTGTIEYDHTGGSSERLVTLTSGTWPSWAADGSVVIADIPYAVSSRLSSTTLQLSVTLNPGDDVAAGTSYTIYRDGYTMPVDFGAAGELVHIGTASGPLDFMPHSDLIDLQRIRVITGTPRYYSFVGDPRRYGAIMIRLYPFPDVANTIAYSYRRQSRRLATDLYSTGTATITNGLTTLTGSGTTWNSQLVGCVIRFPIDASSPVPTGLAGANPFFVERTIAAYVSETSMTLDQDPQVSLAGVKYSISDPLDIEPGPMLTFFLREVEMQCRTIKRMTATDGEPQAYLKARTEAFEADAKTFADRTSYDGKPYPMRLADFPASLP